MNKREINKLSFENDFQENIKILKSYIIELLRKKEENIKNHTKEEVEKIIGPKPAKKETLFEKLFSKKENTQDKLDLHSKDNDEYIPQDMEIGESMWKPKRFAEIFPPFIWYYTTGKKSYFDSNTNLWSKKKQLKDIDIPTNINTNSHNYSGIIPDGITAIALPEWSLPDINTISYSWNIPPYFQTDQQNCIYLISEEKQYVSFNFYTSQNIPVDSPIKEDLENIIHSPLTRKTQNLLSYVSWSSPQEISKSIQTYIWDNKKYSTRLQWTLRNKSNKKNYIANLDKSDVLECFSANALLVWLCRRLSVPSRLVTWHMVDSVDTSWKSLLSSNTWHAWSEIWDDNISEWIRIDATPITQEDGSPSNENMQSPDENTESNLTEEEKQQADNSDWVDDNQWWNNNESWADWNSTWEENWESWEQGGEPNWESNGATDNNNSQWAWSPDTSPEDMLDDFIEQAKQDNLISQWDQLKKILEELENNNDKSDIKNTLDNSWLTDFAKDIVDELGNSEIIEQEKEEIETMQEEADVEAAIRNSLLDKEYKELLKEYADKIIEKIVEEKRKERSEMERMWFGEQELELYKMYKALEQELKPQVRQQIRVLEKILPANYKTVQNEDEYFSSGSNIWDIGKLINYTLIWDDKIFQRNKEKRESSELNMFETIIIDRSWSMWNFSDLGSALRETVKAAIIRAKVLEHFKVNFSIVFFDDNLEEVMSFGEKFSAKKRNNIPSRLMRAAQESGGTNIWEPLAYTMKSMKNYSKKNNLKSFGNISFLWDGEPVSWLQWEWLKSLIREIRKTWFGLTAYYINGSQQNRWKLEWYFWDEESGWTVLVLSIQELTEKLISSYNANLKHIIKRYTK